MPKWDLPSNKEAKRAINSSMTIRKSAKKYVDINYPSIYVRRLRCNYIIKTGFESSMKLMNRKKPNHT